MVDRCTLVSSLTPARISYCRQYAQQLHLRMAFFSFVVIPHCLVACVYASYSRWVKSSRVCATQVLNAHLTWHMFALRAKT